MAASGLPRAAGLAAAGLSTLILLRKVEELPIAYHEAGHSVMAVHYESSGVCAAAAAGEAIHFHAGAAGSPALLRFATIVPRETPNGHYVGETKLSVRWRHMADHAEWSAAGHSTAASMAGRSCAAPLLDLRPVDVPRERRVPGSGGCDTSHMDQSDRPLALLGARLAYLMGGRVAEDLLRGASTEDPHAGLLRLIASPNQASGDLRQIRRLVGGSAALEERPELAQQAYAYSAAVLGARWPQVQALAGAMCVLGTVSGAQCAQLLCSLDETAHADGGQGGRGLLTLTRPWPFAYGCAWGLSRPAAELLGSWRHPRAHESWAPKPAHAATPEYAHPVAEALGPPT